MNNPSIEGLRRTAVERHRAVFGRAPEVFGWSPGRVNLIGDHVDYCGGVVLPMAIDLYTVVAAGRRADGRIGITSVSRDCGAVEVTPPRLGEAPAWTRYAAGVQVELERSGAALGGVDLSIASEVPEGGGLSSSAALEAAAAMAMAGLAGLDVPRRDLALLCQSAEREHAGVPCGIMDQYTVLNSGGEGREAALLLDCDQITHRDVRLPAGAVIVAESGVKHALASGEYARRRAECEAAERWIETRLGARHRLGRLSEAEFERVRAGLEPVLMRRVRHVVSECARVRDCAAALERGDLGAAGRRMCESHASLRDDFEVSCAELDALVAAAMAQPGVHGARMTGGGFGGSVVVLADGARAEAVAAALRGEGGGGGRMVRAGVGAGWERVR